MAGKFVLKKGSGGKYHFNLVAGNGRSSRPARPTSARSRRSTGIESVKTNAPGAETDDQTGDSADPGGGRPLAHRPARKCCGRGSQHGNVAWWTCIPAS